MKKTFVYIDGFNLYYRAVKDTPYKWLNVSTLCDVLLPKNKILKIKYFTARIKSRPDDPNKPSRQQTFLRALKTIPNCEIIYGYFLTHEKHMPVAGCPPGQQRFEKVIKTEEKGSDVNIASHLINDGYKREYEVAVIITNDSDLCEPINIVRRELGLPVIILNPSPKNPSHQLSRVATFVKPIRQGVLGACQFSNKLRDSNGIFSKPSTW